MSTQSTTMKSVQALLKLASLLTAFVVTSLLVQFANADDVLIFYNSDPKLAISRHDGALVTHNSELLAQQIKKMNPELNVKLHPVGSLSDVMSLLEESSEKVRGVMFVGHGNKDVYALNNQSQGDGYQMADVLANLPKDKISSKLTVYFLGCEMGRPHNSNDRQNFQQYFYAEYMKRLQGKNSPSVDVIAHTSMSAYKSFNDPNRVQSLSYRSGLGRWAENITLNKGFVMPNLSFLAMSVGAAYAGGFDQATIASVGAAALAAVFTKAYIEGGISKYGVQLSGQTPVRNSIANLLRTSFQADQCQAIFKTRSI